MDKGVISGHPQETPAATFTIAEKYLVFCLGENYFGLEMSKVFDIVGYMHSLRLPDTPPYIYGLINFKNRLIPLIDLHIALNIEKFNPPEKSCIIITEIMNEEKKMPIGILADSVKEIVRSSDCNAILTRANKIDKDSSGVRWVLKKKNMEIILPDIANAIAHGTAQIAVSW